jgi:hypothetical protein
MVSCTDKVHDYTSPSTTYVPYLSLVFFSCQTLLPFYIF